MTGDCNTQPTRRLLAVVLLFVAISALGGPTGYTLAYSADRDLGGNNTVQGGTLDFKLAEIGPSNDESTVDEAGVDRLVGTWTDLQHRDGSDNDTVYNTIELDSAQSTLSADRVGLSLTYAENDTASGAGGNVDATARTFEIRSFEYGGRELVGTEIADENGNGVVDVEDATLGPSATNLTSLGGVPAGETAALTLELSGNSTRGAGTGSGDGLDVTLEIRVHASAFAETDYGTKNTIRYE